MGSSPYSSRRFALAASAALIFIVATTVLWLHNSQPSTYTTAIGEQRSLTLPDGSSVNLNSRSQIAIRFSETERTITLLEGQALFDVAKDAARPFTVLSGETKVRAIGTQFDVYKKSSGTVVTVIEGRVAVSSSVLSAGQQVIATPRAVTSPRQANIAVATAWTQKKLIFDSAPLAEVVEEFNRYNTRRLVLEDAQLEDYHISGVFSSSDPKRLIEFLRQRFGVTAEESSSAIRISRR